MTRVLVTYDIPCDRRRTKLQKRLQGWLHRVQKSVFEGELPLRSLPKLQRVIAHQLDEEEDDVRIYVLCEGCGGSTVLMGRARRTPDPRDPVVV